MLVRAGGMSPSKRRQFSGLNGWTHNAVCIRTRSRKVPQCGVTPRHALHVYCIKERVGGIHYITEPSIANTHHN